MSEHATIQPLGGAEARTIAARFRLFHESLTATEQEAFDLALRRAGVAPLTAPEDAGGYLFHGATYLAVARLTHILEMGWAPLQLPPPPR